MEGTIYELIMEAANADEIYCPGAPTKRRKIEKIEKNEENNSAKRKLNF